MNAQDMISVSEFRARTKFFLDAALERPMYIRRGDEVFELRKAGTTVLAPAIGLDSNAPTPTIGWAEITKYPVAGTHPIPEKIASLPQAEIPEIEVIEDATWCTVHDCNPEQCRGAHV